MDLQSIECQLAQAQMARYLAGDQLPEDTVKQLEKHITDCAVCQKSAADKQISLEKMLSTGSEPAPVVTPYEEPEATAVPMPEPGDQPQPEPAPEPAPAPAPAEETIPKDPFADLTSVFNEPDPVPDVEPAAEPAADAEAPISAPGPEPAPEPVAAVAPEPTSPAEDAPAEPAAKRKGIPTKTVTITVPDVGLMTKGNLKTIAMAGGLGVVLIGMSVMMRGTKDVLGEKALAAKESEVASEEAPPAKDKKSKAHAEEKPAPKDAEKPHAETKPAAKPAPEPKHTEPATKPIAANTTKPATPTVPKPNAEEYDVASTDGGVKKASIENGKQVASAPVQPPAKPKPTPTPAKAAPAKPKPKATVTKRYRRSTKPYRRHSYRRAKPKNVVRVYEEES